MTTLGEYRVLHPSVERGKFEQLAREIGLVQHKVWEGDGKTQAYDQVWVSEDQANAVHYVEDPFTGTKFVNMIGARSRSLLHWLEALPHFTREELIELAEAPSTHDEKVDVLHRLAVATPEYDPEVFSIFDRATRLPDAPLLREAAVNALAYHAWPELAPLLERLIDSDPDEKVRARAARLLAQLRKA